MTLFLTRWRPSQDSNPRAEYLETHDRGSIKAVFLEYLELYGKCR